MAQWKIVCRCGADDCPDCHPENFKNGAWRFDQKDPKKAKLVWQPRPKNEDYGEPDPRTLAE